MQYTNQSFWRYNLTIFLSICKNLRHVAGSISLASYGHEVLSDDDELIVQMEKVAQISTTVGTPGQTPVDIFPFRMIASPFLTLPDTKWYLQFAFSLHGFPVRDILENSKPERSSLTLRSYHLWSWWRVKLCVLRTAIYTNNQSLWWIIGSKDCERILHFSATRGIWNWREKGQGAWGRHSSIGRYSLPR